MTDDDVEQATVATGRTIQHPAQARLAGVLRDIGAGELAKWVEDGALCCEPNPIGSLPPCLLEAGHGGRYHRANWSDETGLHEMEWDSEYLTALRRRHA